jgi:predicted flap endonuclease-1-like 5' DNA nuclease
VKEGEQIASFATVAEEASPIEAKAAEESQTVVLNAEEEARRAAEAKAAEEARQAAAKVAEEARRAAEAMAAEEARRAVALEAEEEARRAAEAKAAEESQQAAADAYPGLMPPGIAAPRNGSADDLKLIKGIGRKNEGICNDLGVYHFDQIADWTAAEAIWVGHRLAFPGRVEREHWIDQAKLLAAGGDTEHSTGVKTGSIQIDATADNPLGDHEAAALRAGLPAQAAAVDEEARHEGRRPYGLKSPLHNQADDLQRIRGIGPKNESRLHALGIWHFDQIAAWSRENVLWVGSYLAFPGRIDREKWIAQAKDLSAGRDSGFRT